jgi:hypothetical protein
MRMNVRNQRTARAMRIHAQDQARLRELSASDACRRAMLAARRDE